MFLFSRSNSTEQPRVSINVGSTLSMTLGKDQKLICNAEGYYPLDVNIEWYRETSGGSPTPSFLKNVLYSSHRLHQDGSYALSAFFYLQPSLEDSGYKYTCRVSHKSLLIPIRKSFYLIVTGESDATQTQNHLHKWKVPKHPLNEILQITTRWQA